jgi:hypothetical protein
LQLIWGPPGSGKTHFLVATILLFIEAHRSALHPTIPNNNTNTINNNNNNSRVSMTPTQISSKSKPKTTKSKTNPIISEGKEFKVLVVAFTHAAIDLLIGKVIPQTHHL